jgi:hypothetical protein
VTLTHAHVLTDDQLTGLHKLDDTRKRTLCADGCVHFKIARATTAHSPLNNHVGDEPAPPLLQTIRTRLSVAQTHRVLKWKSLAKLIDNIQVARRGQISISLNDTGSLLIDIR